MGQLITKDSVAKISFYKIKSFGHSLQAIVNDYKQI